MPNGERTRNAGGKWERKYTADELNTIIENYISEHSNSSCPPLWEELINVLGISRNTWDSWRDAEIRDSDSEDAKIEKTRTSEIIKKTESRLASGLINAAYTNSKNTAMSVFLLKQRHYGGYTDIPQINMNASITVKMEGCGDGAAE